MMRAISLMYAFVCLIQTSVPAQPCTTNFLNNPSFESPIQVALGNNFTAPYNTFNGWRIPSATAGIATGGFNVIKVNGTAYSGGPNIAHGAGNQYVDINNAGGSVQQNFTLSCPATISFSGWFSRREPGGTAFSSSIQLLNGATVVATSSIVNFTTNESEETWKQVIGSTTLSAGTYTFSFVMDNFANIDDAFLCASPGCVLPIIISDFSVVAEKCTDKLSWKTSSEINSSRFEIEYSNDGINFKTVGTIATKNIATGANYYFNNSASGIAKSFYRLKGIDIDGRISFSTIINGAAVCKEVSIKVFPNPVTDMLHVNIANNSSSKLIIYNTEGKTEVLRTVLTNGDNTINVRYLTKGVYIVKVFGPAEINVFSITKL